MRNYFAIFTLFFTITTMANQNISEFTLENGLKIFVKENHRAPVAIFQIWYKIGSSYEYDGLTGISHVLEHMMFKGTEKYDAGEYFDIVAADGGDTNAFTSRDYTGYYIEITSNKAELFFELESDRMQNLKLNPQEFSKELKVVQEERFLRVDDNPRSLAYEQFNATAFLNGAYRNPVIGWMVDLEGLTLEDIQHWYQTWYSPNNTLLVAVGDVNPQEIYTLAQQYFGAIPAATLPKLRPRTEIPQYGLRRVYVTLEEAKAPALYMGYKVPNLKNAKEKWEPYALEVLAYALDGDESSRLVNTLVRDQKIAASISARYSPYARLESLFTFSGIPSETHNLEDLEQAIYKEIENIKQNGITQEELNRLKTQILANEIYQQDSISYQAIKIGRLEAIGLGHAISQEYIEAIEKITSEQVQAVAKKYLINQYLTIAELHIN